MKKISLSELKEKEYQEELKYLYENKLNKNIYYDKYKNKYYKKSRYISKNIINYSEKYQDKNKNIYFYENQKEKNNFMILKNYRDYKKREYKEDLSHQINLLYNKLKNYENKNDIDFRIDFNLYQEKLKEYYSL